MGNPAVPPTWATEVNFPPGPYPWNGQPLSVAPVPDYFTPSPAAGTPVKITAEGLNYLFQTYAESLSQFYQNGNFAVADVAGLRALPIPAFNQTIFVPRGGGAQVITSSDFASPIANYSVGFGGYYYYDTAYNVLDNGCTAIRPTANPSGAGMWRLQGGPLFTCTDVEYDATYGNPPGAPNTAAYQALTTSGGPDEYFVRGPTPVTYVFSFVAGTAGSIGPGKMYVGDIIDASASILVQAVGGDVQGILSWRWNPGGTPIGIGGFPSFILPASTTASVIVVRGRYQVTSADVTAGSAQLAPLITQSFGAGTCSATLIDCHMTVRRP
jgi:hypothetical protein